MGKRRKRMRPTEIQRREMAETVNKEKGTRRGETMSFITNIEGKKFQRKVKDFFFGLGLWAFLRMDLAKK